MIVTIASGKGGVGKTTTAGALLYAALQADIPVRGINTDPQRSLVQWLGEQIEHRPDIATAETLEALDTPNTLLVVDTPPGTSIQAVAALEAADVIVGCTGASTADMAGLTYLADQLGSLDSIDLVAVGRYDGRNKLAHGILNMIHNKYGAKRVVVFPYRIEVGYAFDQQRPFTMASPVALAGAQLLAHVLDHPAAQQLRKAAKRG